MGQSQEGRVEEGTGGGVTNITGLLKSHMETYQRTIALYLDLVHALRSKLTPLRTLVLSPPQERLSSNQRFTRDRETHTIVLRGNSFELRTVVTMVVHAPWSVSSFSREGIAFNRDVSYFTDYFLYLSNLGRAWQTLKTGVVMIGEC